VEEAPAAEAPAAEAPAEEATPETDCPPEGVPPVEADAVPVATAETPRAQPAEAGGDTPVAKSAAAEFPVDAALAHAAEEVPEAQQSSDGSAAQQGGSGAGAAGAADAASQPPKGASDRASSGQLGGALGSSVVPIGDHRRIWHPRHNKCPDEKDTDPSWYRHKRHIIIFTYSGKPVYTRYGSEDGINTTTAALSAIVSKFAAFFFANNAPGKPGSEDSLRYMTAGEHIFVFLEKGPLWLVCVSRCGDTYPDLTRLLDRVYQQVITILTTRIERTLQERPNYDMRGLLGGTEIVVNNMVRWCTQDMHLQFDGYEPLPLAPASRSIAVEALRSARINNVLAGWIMAGHRVLAITTNRQFKLHPVDLVAILNLICSSASLRTGESWTPLCLAHLNDKAYAYAYISFIEDSDVGVVFLSMNAEGDQFYAISQQAQGIKRTLKTSGCLTAINDSIASCPISLRASTTDERGDKSSRKIPLAPFPAGQAKLLDGVIHAAYYVPSSQQFFSSAIAAPYRNRRRTKILFRSYGRCRLLLRNARMPSQICIATDHECFYVSLAAEFHIYLTVPRGISTGVIGQFYQWIKSQEAYLFLGNIPQW